MIAVMTQIVAIDFRRGVAYCDDGVVMAVVDWFDCDNQPTDDWSEAVSFVCSAGDRSYLGKVADWKRRTMH